ncbi:MAG: hypothetical protein U1D30_13585 [Planctomycetota bacterium]
MADRSVAPKGEAADSAGVPAAREADSAAESPEVARVGMNPVAGRAEAWAPRGHTAAGRDRAVAA